MKILKWIGGLLIFFVGFMAVRKLTKYNSRAKSLNNQAQAKAAQDTDEALEEAKVLQRKAMEAKTTAKAAEVKMRNRREQLKEQGNENMASRLDRLNKL